MTYPVDQTHNPELTSWVESANASTTEFPVQNLPFCVFRNKAGGNPSAAVAIGDQLLDLQGCADAGLLPADFVDAASLTNLVSIMALAPSQRLELRHWLSDSLSDGNSAIAERREQLLVAQESVELLLPCRIGNYTDFYASIFHATNVGSMLRPDNPLLPNYKHIPIGYHGRASSVVASGTPCHRPCGQLPPAEGQSEPSFGPCKNLDYELEVGMFVGRGNELGQPIPIARAEEHLFGLCLLNDWSARDMQRWEYQPLGPFLAKSFLTTISPFIVTMEALAPFRSPAFSRPDSDPQPLGYLLDAENQQSGGVDLQLEVTLETEHMRREGIVAQRLSCGSLKAMYWTIGQMLTHHASNGCNLQTGDLLGTGTVSGPERNSRGCLLELTWDGEYGAPVPGSQRTPLSLPSGEKRVFLAAGDRVTLRGSCERAGFRKIGFGPCVGTVVN
jgi:fumarylacetoacetase